MTSALDNGSDGRVPLPLRIGVTGHRHLQDQQATSGAVTAVLARIRREFPADPATPVVLVVVSALAEGADRLVAAQVMAYPGSRLEAALPFPRTAYARDFATAASRAEFRALLARASAVWQAQPAPCPEEAYERTGRHIADSCDVLIAVWDGKPARGRGGTAHVVEYAREVCIPLVWIQPVPGQQPRYEGFTSEQARASRAAAADLDRFNTTRISRPAFQAQRARQLTLLGLGDNPPDPAPAELRTRCEQVASALVPPQARADLLAQRLQRRFTTIATAMFAIAAVAVTAIAIQAIFWPSQTWGVAIEIPLLIALLAVPATRNRHRLHERWTTHRYLAERLRSAYFLSIAGDYDRTRLGRPASYTDHAAAWVDRALTEITAATPDGVLGPPDVAPLRRYLSGHWITGQARYHAAAAGFHGRHDHAYRRATAALYAATLAAAIIHLADPGHQPRLTDFVVTVSICAPAMGAAVHGIATQRSHRHHAQRSERTADLLTRLARQMDEARDLEQIQQIAADTELLIREENNDWFGVMRFRDIELIT